MAFRESRGKALFVKTHLKRKGPENRALADPQRGRVDLRRFSLCLVALAVFPHHVMGLACLGGRVGLREGESGGEGKAGNNEAGSDMADHEELPLKIGIRRIV